MALLTGHWPRERSLCNITTVLSGNDSLSLTSLSINHLTISSASICQKHRLPIMTLSRLVFLVHLLLMSPIPQLRDPRNLFLAKTAAVIVTMISPMTSSIVSYRNRSNFRYGVSVSQCNISIRMGMIPSLDGLTVRFH